MTQQIVLDQNYLRFQGLSQLIASAPDTVFIIPDIAFVEMCKGDKWNDTMRGSLATLAQIPDSVRLSISVGEAIREERSTLTNIDGRLLPDEFVVFMHSMLKDVAKNISSAHGIDLIAGGIEAAQQEFNEGELNHEKNQERYLQRNAQLKSDLGVNLIKAFRNGEVSETLRLRIICELAQKLLQNLLLNDGHTEQPIAEFIKTKPLLLRYYILLIQQDIEWVRKGGIESQPAARITNNILDQEYVLIASFFDGLMSRDRKVVESDQDLRLCLRMTWPEWMEGPLEFDQLLLSDLAAVENQPPALSIE